MNKETRVLNRIARIDQHGVCFEADPRHVERLLRALPIESSVNSPGTKDDDIDYDAVLEDLVQDEALHDDAQAPDQHGELPVATIRSSKTVSFSETPSMYPIQPEQSYSMIYDIHPRYIVPTRRGTFKRISDNADPFTGKSTTAMDQRRAHMYLELRLQNIDRHRLETLNSTIRHGAAWQRDTANTISPSWS